MKFTIISLLFLATLAQGLPNFSENLDEFDQEFNILVESDAEKQAEADRLKQVEAEINEENELFESGKANFGERLYPFSDWSKDDFESQMLGLIEPSSRAMGLFLPPESERNTPENQARLDTLYHGIETNRAYTPRTYSSQSMGHVTKAKNQGNCGSCAAFAATGLHETCMAKAGAPLGGLDLSEQYLVDCGYNGRSMNGCNGASPHAYPKFFADDGGVSPHEVKYPYLDKYPNLNCRKASRVSKWNSGARVTGATYDYSCNEDKLKQLVYQKGAVLVGIYASDDDFMGYDGRGVFDKCSRGQRMNHAVLVVGYGTENGRDYWLVKNSWGAGWGLNGFIKIRRGTNECGIADVCVVTDCSASGRPDYAPSTPPPPPIPVDLWCDVSGMFQGRKDITGTFELRSSDRGHPGKTIESEVRCKNSVCTPKIPGPSNACMYICGAVKC